MSLWKCWYFSGFPWNSQFKYVNWFLCGVNNHNVWLQWGNYYIRWQCPPCLCLVSKDIYKTGILFFVKGVGYVVEYAVMSPGESSLVQRFSATVQNMVQCLFAIAPAFVIWHFTPLFQVSFSRQGVNTRIQKPFHYSFRQIVDVRLPSCIQQLNFC